MEYRPGQYRGQAPGRDEAKERGPAAYVAEFIGTLALVFFITMAMSVYVTPATQANPAPFIDYSVIGLVHVFVLFMLIQTMAVISGAHFNPAVTVAMTALRQIKPADAGIYVVSQFAGAVAAVLLTRLLTNDFPNAQIVDYGATLVSANLGDSIPLGMLAEGIGTFFLVWVIVGVAVSPQGIKDWAGFSIGATLGLLAMVFTPFTGAGFNPARSFGPALVSGNFGGAADFLLVYVLAPVLGALLAATAYFNLFIAPGKKGEGGFGPVG